MTTAKYVIIVVSLLPVVVCFVSSVRDHLVADGQQRCRKDGCKV